MTEMQPNYPGIDQINPETLHPIYYNSMEVRPVNSLSTYKVSIFVHSAHRNRAKKACLKNVTEKRAADMKTKNFEQASEHRITV